MFMPSSSIRPDVSIQFHCTFFVDVNLCYSYNVRHLQVQHLSIETLISLLSLVYNFQATCLKHLIHKCIFVSYMIHFLTM
jgi:hypothetical protein